MPAVDRGIDNEEEEEEEDLRRRTSPPSRGAVAASVAVEREEEERQGAKATTPTSPTGAGNKRDKNSPGFLCTVDAVVVAGVLLVAHDAEFAATVVAASSSVV